LAGLALASARAHGPGLFDQLTRELAMALDVPLVLLAVVTEEGPELLRTLAVCLDGQPLPPFDFHACEIEKPGSPSSFFERQGMASAWTVPFADSTGQPLGVVVAMDRRQAEPADAAWARDLLEVVAGRAAAEIERARTEETLRAVALGVSESRSGSVFEGLVRLLATILQVDVAFIAQPDAAADGGMRMLALSCAGQVVQDVPYSLAGTPCATVLGQCFRAYPSGVQGLFPQDRPSAHRG
jgi:hypothetical protein